jgi:hypothetical protein
LSQKVRASELFDSALQDNNQFMNHISFPENHLIGFVVPGSHVLKELFLVNLDEGKQLTILLEHIFCVILEHDLLEVILPDYF